MKKLLAIIIICFIAVILAFPYRHKIIQEVKALLGYQVLPSSAGTGNCKNCRTLFPDNVKTHEKAYQTEGISPQKNDDGLKNLFKKGELLKLISTRLYTVDKLTHSQPYILPKGQSFIDELAKRYKEKCSSNSLKYVPFIITSVTRSVEAVKRLGPVNPNSIKESAHLKGKTFDISSRAFNNNKKQNEAFISVLSEMRMEGMCYVKFESNNGCLHITVR